MDSIRVILPKRYDLVVGDTFQLFFRGVVEAPDPFFYDIVAVCERGSNFPRYFECTPEEEGEFELTVSVYDKEKTLLGRGTTKLRVTAPAAPEKPVSILCIGDSLTEDGDWVCELKRRLTAQGGAPEGNGLSNIRFIGTCEKNGTLYEGRGGWQWETYMTVESGAIWVFLNENDKTDADQHSIWLDEAGNKWKLETIYKDQMKFLPYNQTEVAKEIKGKLTHISNAVNPSDIFFDSMKKERISSFYSEKKKDIDFEEYCYKNKFEGIDGVYILLGWNGLAANKVSIPEFCKKQASAAERMIKKIHEAYPKAWVRIVGLQVPSVNGGTGASYGANLPYCDDYGLTRYVMELNLAYENLCLQTENKDFLEFVNLSGQFDSDYNMPAEEKCVNTRNAKTERIGTNGVHPSYEGKMQIADAIYRNAVKSIKL